MRWSVIEIAKGSARGMTNVTTLTYRHIKVNAGSHSTTSPDNT